MERRFATLFLESHGFSLIELLVVIGMLAVLFTLLIGILDPLEQFNKSNDAKRESELNQIKVALDSYFNDTGCYPSYLQFGVPWTDGNTVYMKTVPQDPQCSADGTHCYLYQTDDSACPQWNVLYATLKSKGATVSTNKVLCPLEQFNETCVPTDYGKTQSGYDYCVLSGNVSASCSTIASNPLPKQYTGGNGASGGTPTPTPTPSPATAPSCNGVAQSDPNYKRYKCNGTCQDAGTGNGYYCVNTCENACPGN